MTALFADTSFFIAYLNPRDAFHREADACLSDRAEPIISTQWVLAELGNYLARGDRHLFVELMRQLPLSPRFQILPVNDQSFREAVELYSERPDKQWSFVDCASFATMKRQRIREALTTDRHFEQAGFVVLLK